MERYSIPSSRSARSGLVLALSAAFVIALGIAGCSKPADTTPPEKTTAPKAAAPAAQAPAAPQPAAAPAPARVPAPANDPAATRQLIDQKIKQAPANMKTPAGQPNRPQGAAASPNAPGPAATSAPGEYRGKTPILDGEQLDLTPPPADQPQPKVVFDREVFIAEPIWRGQQARFEFCIRNEGQGVLNTKMKSCCGLSVNGVRSGWPGWSLKPGEVEVFELTLGPSAPGDFTRFSPLHTNDPNHPKINFTCKGRVLTAFKLDPQVVNLGKVQPDSGPLTRVLNITRGDGGALAPQLIPPKDACVKAELKEVKPGEHYTLEVTVTPPSPDFRSSLVLETGVTQAPRETILIVTQQETEHK